MARDSSKEIKQDELISWIYQLDEDALDELIQEYLK